MIIHPVQLARAAALCLAVLGSSPVAARTVTVLELFTSQSCALSRPAGELLGRLAELPDTIALSLPVDYWDHLGWTDTSATPENTARQKAYAAGRGDREVFTPQIVVNGRAAVLGSDEAAIVEEVARQTASGEAPAVPVDVTRHGEVLEIRIDAADRQGDRQSATIWVGTVESEVSALVERGENAGHEMTHHNVVRSLQPVGMWRGEAMSIDLPSAGIEPSDGHFFVVLLQGEDDDQPGPILGAAMAH